MDQVVFSAATLSRLGFRLDRDEESGNFWVVTPSLPAEVRQALTRAAGDAAIPARRDGSVHLGGQLASVMVAALLDRDCPVEAVDDPRVHLDPAVEPQGEIHIWGETAHGEVVNHGVIRGYNRAKEIAAMFLGVAFERRVWIKAA